MRAEVFPSFWTMDDGRWTMKSAPGIVDDLSSIVYRQRKLVANFCRAVLGGWRQAAVLVDPAHDRLDIGLFDRQVADAVARRHIGDQGGGGRRLAVEAQPDARPLVPQDLGA